MSSGLKRILVALVAVPLALAAVFYLPSQPFLLLLAAVFTATAREYARLARHWVPSAPLWSLLILVPAATYLFGPLATQGRSGPMEIATGMAVLLVAASLLSLLRRTEIAEVAPAMGFLAFGTLYFALPGASLFHLQDRDPWWVFLLCGIVWCGDSAAYYVGSALGRHKMAPLVSPNKTWEGAAGGLVASLLIATLWCHWRLGSIDLGVLLVSAAAAVAGQCGDLLESAVKRGAGVKDSSNLLPGHGGLYDRLDAMLLAAPVFFFGLRTL